MPWLVFLRDGHEAVTALADGVDPAKEAARLEAQDYEVRDERPPVPVADPEPLPHGAFCRMCAWTGVTSHAEAIAFGRDRTMPAFFLAVFATLDATEQPAAELEAVTAETFRFDHPLVVAAGNAKGWTEATRRAVWTEAREAHANGWTRVDILAVQAAAAIR